MNKLITLCLVFFISHCEVANGQTSGDWPSSLNYFKENNDKISNQICDKKEVKHREVVTEAMGREYYCNGNLHAEGPIKKLKSRQVIYSTENNRKVTQAEFIRHGKWRVYYDSTVKILRSEGAYHEGKMDGTWMLYSTYGKPTFKIEFSHGLVKNKIEIDEAGNHTVLLSRTNSDILVNAYKLLLLFIAVIPITLIRIGWNISTYNKINGNLYIPGFQNMQKGGYEVNMYCTFIFWWICGKTDSEEVKNYKRIGNWISIISIICFAGVTTLFILYGEK